MTTSLKTAVLLLITSLLTSTAVAFDPIPLRAGPDSMVFDAENVFLRYLRVGQHEVLRGINAPVRDQDWATVAPKVSNLQIENQGDSFELTFDVVCQQDELDFRWKGTITGNEQGEIEFTFDGEAHSTFKKSRIGFCVLHGPSAAGQPWSLETTDGRTVAGNFPQFIAPHQPAKDLRAITHEVAPGISARVEFEGDTFEMEDQRNWTDASFKTYCTPLVLPYPVELRQGTKVFQKIRIRVDGDLHSDAIASADRTVLTLLDEESVLPRIGLQVSSEVDGLTGEQLARLKALDLDHLHVDLTLSDKSFVKHLRRANQQAKDLDVSLHIVLSLGDTPDFDALADAIKTLQPTVSHWLVRGGDPKHFAAAREFLTPLAGKAQIGVTRVTNFVDLNQNRPDSTSVQAIGFAINPQIHAFDNASIIETLPIHADVVRSARQFARDVPLIIGPITLAPQLLDGEDQPGGPSEGGPWPTYIDKRQVEPFVAAWTLGSLKYLADAGAHSTTFFETVGWAGVMDADDVSSRTPAFPSRPGQVFPIYELLRQVGEFAGGRVRRIETSDELAAVGMALYKPGRLRVIVANLKGSPQTITLRGLDQHATDVLVLGNTEPTRAMTELSIHLPPYGIASIDRKAEE